MKRILKVWDSKLFMHFVEILLVGCIILLINACLQCKIPKEVVNHDVKPNDVPKSHQLILSDYSYKNRIYTLHENSIPSKDLTSKIWVADPLDTRDSVPAFKLKGIDVKKSIAIGIKYTDSTVYFQAYNYRYWVDQLPKILIYSVLTLIFSATLLINLKFNSAKIKI